MKFRNSIIAGTFDHLHLGHQKLLNFTIQNSLKVSIGLTQKNLYQKKQLSNLIQPKSTRFQTIKKLLNNYPTPSTIFNLTNPLEPAASTNQFDSIVASTQTKPVVKKINQIRLQNNLKPLKTHFIKLVKSTDHQTLSSTRIRQGQVNRNGFAYHQVFPKNKKLTLPPIHRNSLKKPFGLLLKGSLKTLSWASLKAKHILKQSHPTMTIAVGDIATLSLLNQKIHLDLAIIDLKTNRQPFFNSPNQLGLPHITNYTINNPPSTITPDLVNALQQSLKDYSQSKTIMVKGEEDLAVLPSILLSPLNTAIFYGQPAYAGQPKKGLVYTKVTETSKQKALELLQKLI